MHVLLSCFEGQLDFFFFFTALSSIFLSRSHRNVCCAGKTLRKVSTISAHSFIEWHREIVSAVKYFVCLKRTPL